MNRKCTLTLQTQPLIIVHRSSSFGDKLDSLLAFFVITIVRVVFTGLMLAAIAFGLFGVFSLVMYCIDAFKQFRTTHLAGRYVALATGV